MQNELYTERRDYDSLKLSRTDLKDNPHTLFDEWINDPLIANVIDRTAMTVATTGTDGQPQARVVLLKKYSIDGFVWFTGRTSGKGSELAQNPKACLLFYWREVERQVRITGSVSMLDAEESADYFHSRPLESRISAAASDQSQPVESRQWLENRFQTLHDEYPDGSIPCPDSWTGYQLSANGFEFWQGRPSRLHDRFRYEQDQNGLWVSTRLCP